MEQENKEPSLVSQVMDRVVRGIVDGKCRDFLPRQELLSNEFGVSRTVLREALSMLLARNMLDVRPKIGTRIRPMSEWRMVDEDVVKWRSHAKPDPLFVRDMNEFRILIMPRAASQAAVRASTMEIAEIREAFEALRAIRPTQPGYQAADELFRSRIIASSGNLLFRQMAGLIRGAVTATPRVGSDRAAGWDEEMRLCEQVVEAIERREAKKAEAASIALIEFSAPAIEEARKKAA